MNRKSAPKRCKTPSEAAGDPPRGNARHRPDELYAKVGSHPLTALKTSSKYSFIPYKPRFLARFCLVMEHDPAFA
uniref:Uncharacterized protein n=1 Tax=Candidatus Kentrum sp. DK TaxID=2126562 RepID=A0A450S0L0_9GAMM|nr:MAG: hypothetical protein BECKDK2373B_GA0170837_100914 [Candidatus Kentron sp. DK]